MNRPLAHAATLALIAAGSLTLAACKPKDPTTPASTPAASMPSPAPMPAPAPTADPSAPATPTGGSAGMGTATSSMPPAQSSTTTKPTPG